MAVHVLGAAIGCAEMPELIVSLKGRELSRHTLLEHTRIGRDPALEVVIDNPGVSRLHASVDYEGGRFVVRDQKSQNGVYVGERRVVEHALAESDVVNVGKFALSFSGLTEAPAQATHGAQVSARGHGMVKTFALNAVEVNNLLAAHTETKRQLAATQRAPVAMTEATAATRGSALWLLAAGLAAALTVALLVLS